jgi:predicted HAD superfamily Cof-like phosphohydrolase
MIDLMSQALEFRASFNQPILSNFTRYGFIKKKLYQMQMTLIEEECNEFLNAADKLLTEPHPIENRVDVLKELADLIYVCYQFAATYNLDLDEALDRIHKSNMSKLDEQGNPIYRRDGKVLKSDGYKPPQLEDLVVPSTTPPSEEYNAN